MVLLTPLQKRDIEFEYLAGTFTLSNLGMFGVDHFDAILPPGTGAIMAVGASEPTVVATKDGRIGMKTQMQVCIILITIFPKILLVDRGDKMGRLGVGQLF
ncbi:putative dihydrolipoyllysine-residue acetyltransferase [Helianthus anomalus]